MSVGEAVSVAGTLGLAVLVLLAARAIARQSPRTGRRPDGSWEDGRRVRDMTAGGKVALAVTVAAFVATVVLGAVADGSVWFWVTGAVGIAAALAGGFSERRRLRRRGLSA